MKTYTLNDIVKLVSPIDPSAPARIKNWGRCGFLPLAGKSIGTGHAQQYRAVAIFTAAVLEAGYRAGIPAIILYGIIKNKQQRIGYIRKIGSLLTALGELDIAEEVGQQND